MSAHKKLYKHTGRKIQHFRERLGLNQQEFATKINRTAPLISFFETGYKMPSLTTVVRMLCLLPPSESSTDINQLIDIRDFRHK